MQKIVFFFSLLSFTAFTQEQIEWEVSYHPEANSLIVKGDLAPGWHIYSMDMDENAGPIPTSIEFLDGANLLEGEIQEPKPIEKYDKDFGSDVTYFEEEVIFIQKVKKKATGKIKFEIVYMLCNDEGCLPPDVKEFNVVIK